MQLMPPTAREVEKELGMPAGLTDRDNDANIAAGSYYYDQQLKRFGNEKLALAAYNGGPNLLASYLKLTNGDADRAISMMPRETRNYVPGVLGRKQGGQPQGGGVTWKNKSDIKPEVAIPSGYRLKANGVDLEPIPGGPAD